ncbi:major facilitator superfamily domain-containing protein 4 [Trichinella spiralis]|uniref:major facilitator superfamily domain-containing protein 4 n=1 Tax=Trichinella spiralis TaxID=6334 RepID=UPI0001EFBF79|nr:major facilitator superfamily domain-containing protein 4 [Trichinella spiralis]
MTISEEKVTNKSFLYDNLTTPTQQAYFHHLLWTHRYATFVYCAVFCSFGMGIAFLGPTLWDLACQTSTPIRTMTWTLHFCYGFGAFLSPIIAGPFLKNFDCTQLIDNSTSNTSWIEQSFLSAQWEEIVHNQPTNMADVQEQLQVHIAFQIMAALQVPVILLLISLVFKEKFTQKSTDETFFTTDYQNISPDSELTELLDSTSVNGKIVIAMAGLILFFADGLQGSFAIGRIMAIFCTIHIIPICLLFINISCLNVGKAACNSSRNEKKSKTFIHLIMTNEWHDIL